jgi:menaquinone-dependent protoporphyrinogen oxidase
MTEGTTKPVLVVYATREGQTRKIAEHVAATLRGRGVEVDVVDARSPPAALDRYGTTILAASIHQGKHEPELIAFAKAHAAELARRPTALLSVSLTEATSEDPTAAPEARARAAAEVQRTIDELCAETGLHPSQIRRVAGALLYRQYGIFKRFMMRMIVGKQGGSTDTSRDHEYTDWAALDAFVDQLAA